MIRRFIFILVLLTFFLAQQLVIGKDNISENLTFIVMTLPFIVQTTIGLLLAIKWKKVIEFLPASILIARFAVCLTILNTIEFKDGKAALQDSVYMVALPLQVCCSTNTRFDLLFTIPFGIFANSVVMENSLGDFDLVGACYHEPELYLRSQKSKWILISLCCYYACHSAKKKHLESYL